MDNVNRGESLLTVNMTAECWLSYLKCHLHLHCHIWLYKVQIKRYSILGWASFVTWICLGDTLITVSIQVVLKIYLCAIKRSFNSEYLLRTLPKTGIFIVFMFMFYPWYFVHKQTTSQTFLGWFHQSLTMSGFQSQFHHLSENIPGLLGNASPVAG